MRIVQTCDEKPEAPKQLARDMAVGTIFTIMGSKAVYTKLIDNRNGLTLIVNLSINGTATSLAEAVVDVVYSNARIVLE